jgi:hypothetical protein
MIALSRRFGKMHDFNSRQEFAWESADSSIVAGITLRSSANWILPAVRVMVLKPDISETEDEKEVEPPRGHVRQEESGK